MLQAWRTSPLHRVILVHYGSILGRTTKPPFLRSKLEVQGETGTSISCVKSESMVSPLLVVKNSLY